MNILAIDALVQVPAVLSVRLAFVQTPTLGGNLVDFQSAQELSGKLDALGLPRIAKLEIVSEGSPVYLDGLYYSSQFASHLSARTFGTRLNAPLKVVLEAAGGVTPQARYVVIDTYDRWYEGYVLFEVEHPQTILTYGLNGGDLPRSNGAPIRLRVERQCGYKQLKFVKSIRVVESMMGIGKGTSGINSDVGLH